MELSSADPACDEALAFLYSRLNYERSDSMPYRKSGLKLQRMRDLLRRIGDPQQTLPIVHVAGTKGKGSTAAMIAAMMKAAGYRCGLYTSPHLYQLEERLTIDSQACSTEQLVALIAQLRPVLEEMDRKSAARGGAAGGPTYFETTTAAALLHFAQCGVDVAVLEVGLGGRLDSTNVCHPLVSVITSISLDHTRQLGTTLSSIAAEKAGIIKPGVPVVSGVVDREPAQVIQAIARQREAELLQRGIDFDGTYKLPGEPPGSDVVADDTRADQTKVVQSLMDYRQLAGPEPRMRLTDVQVALLGRHQIANASVAITALNVLRQGSWNLPDAAIRRGLAQVRLPARVEILAHAPTVVLDAAHNVASLQALVQTLDESLPCRQRVLVFATTQGKDVRGMLQFVVPRFDKIIFTRYLNNPRALDPQELCDMLVQWSAGQNRESLLEHTRVIPDPAAAWQAAGAEAAPEDLICVTGSFFIAAEIRALILPPADHLG